MIATSTFIWAALHLFQLLVLTSLILFCLNLPTFLDTMVLTKANVRKNKGASTPAPKVKRTKKAGNKRLGPTTTMWGQHQTDTEEVAVTVQHDVIQKFDAW